MAIHARTRTAYLALIKAGSSAISSDGVHATRKRPRTFDGPEWIVVVESRLADLIAASRLTIALR